jgi:hypothetical protein
MPESEEGRPSPVLAEADATTHELMSVSGHRTLAQLQVYTEDVNRKKLADKAIEKRIRNR